MLLAFESSHGVQQYCAFGSIHWKAVAPYQSQCLFNSEMNEAMRWVTGLCKAAVVIIAVTESI
jgi:hypothetical protein